MPEAFLETSVVIGLLFRNAAERKACEAAIPEGHKRVCSRYVTYELARGFLRSLITLHNQSFEYQSFSALHQAAHSGQRRFRPYAMHTWLGAFDDYFEALDDRDGVLAEPLKVEEFRAKLRGWIRRGWSRLDSEFDSVNRIGCKKTLPPPVIRDDDLIDQHLPIGECGTTTACEVQEFVQKHLKEVTMVEEGLSKLRKGSQDKETKRRILGLAHLKAHKPGTNFEGQMCFACGDAFICLEALPSQAIVTKNAKHYEPIAKILGKAISVAKAGIIR